MVQEKVQFPCEANGYYGVVSTADSGVVVSFQDKMSSLKEKVSAHQLLGKIGDKIPC